MWKLGCYLAAACLVLLSGCDPYGTALSAGSGSTSVGETNVTYYSGDKGMLLVVWIQNPSEPGLGASGGGSGASSSAAKTVLRGNYQTFGGKKIDWNCETADGKSGSVVVNGKTYELAKGGLFLVRTLGESPEVTQLSRDMTKLKTGADLEALAKSDPEVKKLVTETRSGETKETP
jgi:hypothetical protein